MEPEMFREFGVPSFGVLDTWWVKTPKCTPFQHMHSISTID